MAAPPAKKPPVLPPTTITTLDGDSLREIFLRLPSLPSLVRAALSCRVFLDAIRSSPAFRRQFRALHPPPLLGLYFGGQDTATPTFVPLLRRSDPDLAAAVRGADLLLTRLPLPEDDANENSVSVPVPEDDEKDVVFVPVPVPEEDDEDIVPVPIPVPASEDEDDDKDDVTEDGDYEVVFEWLIHHCHDGFVVLNNWSTRQIAVYNPLMRTMDLFPLPPHDDSVGLYFDVHILTQEDDCRSPYRVVCVLHDEHGAGANVLSSDTGKWQVFPWTDIDGHWPQGGKLVNGCIYWTDGEPLDARVLNTATMQFFRMDMPPSSTVNGILLTAGRANDGKLCVVITPAASLTFESVLVVWIRRADDDGVERWMLDRLLPLQEILGIVDFGDTDQRVELRVMAIVDGFVYLFAYCGVWEHHHTNNWLLSFCIETAVLKNLGRILHGALYPYFMPWPHSLVGTQQVLAPSIQAQG